MVINREEKYYLYGEELLLILKKQGVLKIILGFVISQVHRNFACSDLNCLDLCARFDLGLCSMCLVIDSTLPSHFL